MKTHVAATVTMDDLKNYFKGEDWKIEYASPSSLDAKSKHYDVAIETKSFMYHVKIEATEDSFDSDEKVTDDPLEFLIKFLGTGTEGDEHFEKMASSPVIFSSVLRTLASNIDSKKISLSKASARIRKIMLATDVGFLLRSFHLFSRYAAKEEIQKEELDDLKKHMLSKGWKVQESTTSAGLPELSVDISGIYKSKISVESIAWKFSFEVRGIDGSKEEGVTDDPIMQFRNYRRKPETQEAKDEFYMKSGETAPAPGTKQEIPTVSPGKKNEVELDKTVAPPSRSKTQKG